MKTAALALLLPLATLLACGAAPHPPAVLPLGPVKPTVSVADRHAAACRGALAPMSEIVAAAAQSEEHRVVRSVTIHDSGGRTIESALTNTLPLHPGEPYDASRARESIRRIWATGSYADVAIEAQADGVGVGITFVATPRSMIDQVFVESGGVADDVRGLHAQSGGAYEPSALRSAARAIEGSYRDRGYLDATLSVASASVRPGWVDVCVTEKLGPVVTIEGFHFVGTTTHATELGNLITSENGSNAAGGVLDRDRLDRDVLMMSAKLFDLGYLTHTLKYRTERRGDRIAVIFDIEESDVYRIGKIDVKGDLGAPKAAYLKLITSKHGDVFNRSQLVSDLAALRAFDHRLGRPEIDAAPETELDRDKHTVDLMIVISDPSKPPPKATGASPLQPPAAVVAPTNLRIVDLALGHGRQARPGDRVSVHYTGSLTNGTVFDSSRTHGSPFVFVLGGNTVIKGFEQGVQGMRVGGRRRVTIPPDLGYGDRGAPPTIPPKATLVFDLELLSAGPP